MNGNPAKPEIAIAQVYFAAQTIRQERTDQLTAENRRMYLRDRVKNANRRLQGAAEEAGVKRYPVFVDAGYRGTGERTMASR